MPYTDSTTLNCFFYLLVFLLFELSSYFVNFDRHRRLNSLFVSIDEDVEAGADKPANRELPLI